jgi:hypothetical protein
MAVAIVLAVLCVAAMWLFGTESGRELLQRGPQVHTGADRKVRFSGRTVPGPRQAGRAPRRRGPRMRGKRRQAGGRMAGAVQHSPDAIGLACGCPISQCPRRDDCLCVD